MGVTGLNIFMNALNRMKQLLFFICLFISVGTVAQQPFIQADVLTGCNPFTVNFSIQPESARDTITSFEWNFGNWTLISTDSTPSVLYNITGTFDVICTLNGNYQVTGNDLITVMDCSDTLDPPNVFSPNDDNINDFFEVKTNGISTYTFSVYTRSGTLIYKTESLVIIWDGRSLSGHKMKNGIYFYTIRQLESEPLNEAKGIVYLFE